MPTTPGQPNAIQPAEHFRPIWSCWPEGGIPPSASPSAPASAESSAPQQRVEFPEAEEQRAAVLREFYCALSTY
jgi:hypothetical protein